MPDLECRLAKVEERVAMHDSTISKVAEEINRQSHENYELLREIERKLNDMQGFSNGVKWTVGAIFAVFGGIAAVIFNKIFGIK
jgi:uncharacterized coiled-coil protein SlyX